MPFEFCKSKSEVLQSIHTTIRSTLLISGTNGNDALSLIDELFGSVAPLPNVCNIIIFIR